MSLIMVEIARRVSKREINKKIKKSLSTTITEGEPWELYQDYVEKLTPVEKMVL